MGAETYSKGGGLRTLGEYWIVSNLGLTLSLYGVPMDCVFGRDTSKYEYCLRGLSYILSSQDIPYQSIETLRLPIRNFTYSMLSDEQSY